MTLEVANELITLGRGDAAGSAGAVAHSYGNPGGQPTQFCLAVVEPGVGSAPVQRGAAHG